MKEIFLALATSFTASYCVAQCNDTVTYFSSKAEFLDNSGKVERSEDGKVTVKVSPSSFVLMHNDDDNDTMNGEITNFSCEWKEPFKNGKTFFNAKLIEKSGESGDATVSIEGKEGKQTILINFKKWDKVLKLQPDNYKID